MCVIRHFVCALVLFFGTSTGANGISSKKCVRKFERNRTE